MGWVRTGVIAAAALLCCMASAYAQSALAALAPCYTGKPSQAAYVDAFLDDGWALAEGDARDAAVQASGEIHGALTRMTPAFRAASDVEAFLDVAQREAYRLERFGNAAYLDKDGLYLRLELAPAGHQWRLSCILLGKELDAVLRNIPNDPPTGERPMAFKVADFPFPPTVDLTDPRMTLVRMFIPGEARDVLVSGHAIYVNAALADKIEVTP